MIAQHALKFGEFVDLLLARLYDEEQSAPQHKKFDLIELAKTIAEPVPEGWVWDAAKVLSSRGLAQCAFFYGGRCIGLLTGEGRLFVEQEEGTGIITRYRREPGNFVIVSGNHNNVVVDAERATVSQGDEVERDRAPALNLLKRIEESLPRDGSLTDEQRESLLIDLAAIKAQVKKREPNRAALAALLEPFSQVASIAGHVANLVRLFNP